MANLNDVLQGLVNLNSKMANNINNLLDSIGEGFLDVGELKVENDVLSLQGATILVNGSNILVENLSTTFAGNKICFLEYKADKSIALKVLPVVDADFNYDLSQLSATSKHFEIARQYNGVLEDRRVASMASKDNTIVGALNGALKAIDYDNEIILSRVSAVESDIVDLDTEKADKTYVDEAVANVDIDGVVTAVDVGEVEDVDVSYVTKEELDENTVSIVKDNYITDANDVMNIQGIRFTNNSTSNLPSDLNDEASKWGVLKTYVDYEGDGVQEYTVSFGDWQGTIFRRCIQTTRNIFGDWEYILDGESWDDALQTNNKTIIGAINELFQSANNGKELIASAIGEPLDSNDTFSAMSSDINSLLSTFKTNMMNNGVTVESSDKFKALIDKLANLSDNEGKGIQFVSGVTTDFIQKDHTYTTVNGDGETVEETFKAYDIELTLDFSPSLIYVHTNYTVTTVGSPYSFESVNIFDALELQALYLADIGSSGTDVQKFPHFIEDNKYYIPICQFTSFLMPVTACESNWYAIGVGEEDTTLRDSLASILQEEGVEVTEGDDMASLIAKVDQKFDESGAGGLDIISATELPATGKDNQICVVMDEPCDNFIVTSELNPNLSEPTVVLHTSSSGNAVTLTNGNITTCLLFNSVYMGLSKYASYVYESSQWKQLTSATLPILINGYAGTDIIGSLQTSETLKYSAGNYIYCAGGTAGLYSVSSWSYMINFDNYLTLKFTAYISSSKYPSDIVFAQSNVTLSTYDNDEAKNLISSTCSYSSTFTINTTTAKEYTIDISSWTGTYYLALQVYQTFSNTYITNIELS